MTTDNFYLPNRLIQISQTGGQWYSDASPLVFPGFSITLFEFVSSLVEDAIRLKRRLSRQRLAEAEHNNY
jgi:hypothetical protein